ncbi:MAG TPA: hypothetical protein VJ281_07670 [Chthoniobacterales bacterium]|jgi:hypothetical protein|nr:hypothetical protein [Chthoniobacterales bacterium]
MASISRILIVAMLCASIGLHWITMQSIAWGMMIVKYSRECSLPEAVAKTFDGQHPCNLCKHISTEQHAPKKPQAPHSAGKPDLLCASTLRAHPNVWKDFDYSLFDFPIKERSDHPIGPPPRSTTA